MKNRFLHKKNGFTLVEVLIYLAIIGIVITSFLYFGISIFGYRNKSFAVQEVQANQRMALGVISQKIRLAKSVNVSQSTFDTDPGILSLAMDDSSKNPTIIKLDQADGVMQIAEGGTSTTTVTSQSVRVKNLIFTNLTSTSSAPNIGINLTIEFNNTNQDINFNYSDDLYTAVSLRR